MSLRNGYPFHAKVLLAFAGIIFTTQVIVLWVLRRFISPWYFDDSPFGEFVESKKTFFAPSAILLALGLWPVVWAIACFALRVSWSALGALARRASGRSPLDGASPVLDALARDLKGRVDGKHFEARFRDRAVSIDVLPDRRRGWRYRVRLETPLGAPRTGSVSDESALTKLATAREPWLQPLVRTLRENQATWEGLFRVYKARDVELLKGAIEATVEAGPETIPVVEEVARLTRLMGRLAAVTESQRPGLDVRERASEGTRCPYCHDALQLDERERVCPECGTRQHAECWSELGRCATFGCSRAKRSGERSGRHERVPV